MSDDREIRYRALLDIAPFAAGAARVVGAMRGMGQGMQGVRTQVAGGAAAISAHVQNLGSRMRGDVAGMAGHFGGLVEALARTKVGLVAATAAAAAFAASKMVDATAKTTEAAMDLGRVMGTSTNEAQVWRIALEDVGSTQEELQGVAKSMSRQLRENEADMQAMGLKTRDAAGQFRPMNQLMLESIGILNDHTEGFDRAQAAQQLFGRAADASSKLLLINKEAIAEAEETMKSLGLEVGEKSVTAWKAWDAATDRAGFSMQGLGRTIGTALMPVLTDMVKIFNAVMPAAIAVARVAVNSFATVWEHLKIAVRAVWETMYAMAASVAVPIGAVSEAIARALAGDFVGAANVIKAVPATIVSAWTEALAKIEDTAAKAHKRIENIWSADTKAGEPIGARGKRNYVAPKKKDKEPKPQGRMPEWDAELSEKKLMFQEDQNGASSFRKFELKSEADFWAEKLRLTKEGSNEQVAVRKKLAEVRMAINKEEYDAKVASLRAEADDAGANMAARVELAQKEATLVAEAYGRGSKEAIEAERRVTAAKREQVDQRKQIDEIIAQSATERRLAEIEEMRTLADLDVELGVSSNAQRIAQETAFEQQRNQIRMQALQARLALIDPDRDPVAYAQTLALIEAQYRDHQTRMGQLSAQAKAEAMRNTIETIDAISQAVGNIASQLGTRIKSWGDLGKSVLDSFRQMAAQTLGKFVQDWVKSWLTAQVQIKVASKVTTASRIAEEAAKAGAGGVASMAAAPYPTNLSAPAFGAAMSTSAMAYAPLASASGGYDIPRGLNPLTQLHAEEMVLPAHLANPLRESLGARKGGGDSQVQQQPQQHHHTHSIGGDVLNMSLRDYIFDILASTRATSTTYR